MSAWSPVAFLFSMPSMPVSRMSHNPYFRILRRVLLGRSPNMFRSKAKWKLSLRRTAVWCFQLTLRMCDGIEWGVMSNTQVRWRPRPKLSHCSMDTTYYRVKMFILDLVSAKNHVDLGCMGFATCRIGRKVASMDYILNQYILSATLGEALWSIMFNDLLSNYRNPRKTCT